MSDDSDAPQSDHEYFKRIERLFISLRGAPLLLSPTDWQVAKSWRQRGIPVELVEQTLQELFARRAEQGNERSVSSLRYARSAVTKAFAAIQQHQAAAAEAAPPEPLDTAARLSRLAAALPESVPDRDVFVGEILALEGDLESVENALASLDQTVLDRAEAAFTDSDRAAFVSALDRAHRQLGVRLPASELARADSPLRRSVLRRLVNLPVLSLFAIEATSDSDPESENGGDLSDSR